METYYFRFSHLFPPKMLFYCIKFLQIHNLGIRCLLLKFYVLHKWDYFQLILQIKSHYSRMCFSHSLSSHRAKFPRLFMHRSCQGSDVVGESVFSKPGLGLILYSCNNNTAGWRIAWVTALPVKNFSPIIHEEVFSMASKRIMWGWNYSIKPLRGICHNSGFIVLQGINKETAVSLLLFQTLKIHIRLQSVEEKLFMKLKNIL